jgi:hypothetical protein
MNHIPGSTDADMETWLMHALNRLGYNDERASAQQPARESFPGSSRSSSLPRRTTSSQNQSQPPHPSHPSHHFGFTLGMDHATYAMIQQTMEYYTKCHRDHYDLMEEIVEGVRSIHAPTAHTTRISLLYQIFQESNRRMMEYNVFMSQCLQFIYQIFQQYRVVNTNTNNTNTPSPTFHAGSRTNTNARTPRPYSSHAQDTATSDLYEFSFFIHPPSESTPTVMPMSQAQFSQYTLTYIYENTNTTVPTTTVPTTTVPTTAVTAGTADRPVCPITLEELQAGDEVTRVRVCGHVFRTAALRNWCRRNRVCPVCRRDIVSDAIPTPTTTPTPSNRPSPVRPLPEPLSEPNPEPVSEPSPLSSYAQRTDYDEVGTNGGRTMIPSSILRRIVQETFDRDNDDDTHYLGVD